MGARSAIELLQLPVRLHGIRLGHPVDLLLDPTDRRALGFVVVCRDESSRFVVFAAADVRGDAIEVNSALLLLEDVGFYRARSRSLRDLLGDGLQDLLVSPDGSVEPVVAEREVESEHVSTA